jgi:hypothetical protein
VREFFVSDTIASLNVCDKIHKRQSESEQHAEQKVAAERTQSADAQHGPGRRRRLTGNTELRAGEVLYVG